MKMLAMKLCQTVIKGIFTFAKTVLKLCKIHLKGQITNEAKSI